MDASTPQKKSKTKRVRRFFSRSRAAITPGLQPPSQLSQTSSALGTGSVSPSLAGSAIPTQAIAQTNATQPSGPAPSGSRIEPTLNATTGPGVSPIPGATNEPKSNPTVAWPGFGAALRILEQGVDTFPPLQSAVSGLIACLDLIQAATENSNEYNKLASELATMVEDLASHANELDLQDPGSRASVILSSINDQVTHIKQQEARFKASRIIASERDREDVTNCFRRIESLFREVQRVITLRNLKRTHELRDKQDKEMLYRYMSPVEDARYDSSYSTTIKRRGCTPKTRENVQADLQSWVQNPKGAKVYWMNGMAGTGKTTIAYSLCEWLEQHHRLGASFFCSRTSTSCRNVNNIVPTIAYQLAQFSLMFESELRKTVDKDPGASKLNVARHFERLVRGPMLAAKDTRLEGLVVVIDALDECDDSYALQLMLEAVLRLAADLPIKFFITSRPEPKIGVEMMSSSHYSPSVLYLHDIEQAIVEEDIKKYIAEALVVMSPPPSREDIERLAKRAGKLFIYAATAVRYIVPNDMCVVSSTRLKAMLATHSASASKPKSTKQYRELDALYTSVLTEAIDRERLEEEEATTMELVLRTVVCAKATMTARTIGCLLELSDQQVQSALEPLQSVLHVPEFGGVVSTLHASFSDYIFDQSRSKDFYCETSQHSEILANGCFDTMKAQLRFNICGLQSSFVLDKDVPDLEERIMNCISPALIYSCLFWGEHLRGAKTTRGLCEKLAEFLTERLLFWMEVLNLKQRIGLGADILQHGQNWLASAEGLDVTRNKTAHAQAFVSRFAAGGCTSGTPHIYVSALPFCSRSSSVYKEYWKRTQGLIDVKGVAIKQWDKAALGTWAAGSDVNSLGFSPEGTRIVSGCRDGTVRVWDARTGDVVAGPFIGHTSWAKSVAFSPDGTRIVSGSDDQTIRVWDARTGSVVTGPFTGHTDSVQSVAFSPDGTRIVSSSHDETIRVWDASTGNMVAGPFTGHTSSVLSVAFSPDGTRIVSGSGDETIRVWDARIGDVVAGPFKGHTSSVFSVAFSPDGTRIVSGSFDKTIRVWDAGTGDVVAGPFTEHKSSVLSVAFSPDGTRIVSGSGDETIRVWDARTGDVVAGPFTGHTDSVLSVVFSPDGTRIISGSGDETIRVWDAHTGDAVAGPFTGHTDSVQSVAFSLDGTRIVSSSSDQTIRVWDARTGDVVAEPFTGHTDSVQSVAFSPDGTRIVSGSSDQTIRVWDASTGDVVAEPFTGHTHWIQSASFSPDGTRIVSGSSDETIRVWDAHTGDVVAGPFTGHTSGVKSVAFSPDGTRIVSGSSDETIRVWDARTGDVVAEPFTGHASWIQSVAFSPDGTRIVSGSGDETIRVWDARTGDMIAGPFMGHTSWVQSVAFSPDGTRIVSGSRDETIRVWDARTGDVVAGPFTGHTDSVESVAFSPDGTRIVSGSHDQTIRVWDACTGDIITDSHHTFRELVHSPVGSSDDTRNTFNFASHAHGVQPSLDPINNLAESHTHPVLLGIGKFIFEPNGWFTGDNLPILWIAPDLRAHFPTPCNTLVIGPQGAVCINYRGLSIGEGWYRCYIE